MFLWRALHHLSTLWSDQIEEANDSEKTECAGLVTENRSNGRKACCKPVEGRRRGFTGQPLQQNLEIQSQRSAVYKSHPEYHRGCWESWPDSCGSEGGTSRVQLWPVTTGFSHWGCVQVAPMVYSRSLAYSYLSSFVLPRSRNDANFSNNPWQLLTFSVLNDVFHPKVCFVVFLTDI